jgi:hypothetical protein
MKRLLLVIATCGIIVGLPQFADARPSATAVALPAPNVGDLPAQRPIDWNPSRDERRIQLASSSTPTPTPTPPTPTPCFMSPQECASAGGEYRYTYSWDELEMPDAMCALGQCVRLTTNQFVWYVACGGEYDEIPR